MIKRFVLFAGNEFYPSGGWADFQQSFDLLASALAFPRKGDWWHIIDLETGKIVGSDDRC